MFEDRLDEPDADEDGEDHHRKDEPKKVRPAPEREPDDFDRTEVVHAILHGAVPVVRDTTWQTKNKRQKQHSEPGKDHGHKEDFFGQPRCLDDVPHFIKISLMFFHHTLLAASRGCRATVSQYCDPGGSQPIELSMGLSYTQLPHFAAKQLMLKVLRINCFATDVKNDSTQPKFCELLRSSS